MTEASLLTAAAMVFFGALAGGLTNAIAIWMLFHPYEPRGPRPFKLQGAIPKNKARLANTIGRTVGQRLLTSDDLTRQLSAPGMREAFHGAVRRFVVAILDTERGALREQLPPSLIAEIERAIAGVASAVADRVAEFVATDGFRDAVERFLERARDEFSDHPVGEVLTAARREALRARVERWVSDAVASPELERTIHEWLDRQARRLAEDATPLLDRLPPELIGAIEREIAGYLPVAIDRLAAVLGDREARARLQRALHELFQRFVRDLLLHERIVARLVVTEKTFERLLVSFEQEGVDQLAALLDEPAMRSQVARSINDAVVNFLRHPMAEHIERLGSERLSGIITIAATHMTAALRDPITRRYGIDQLDRALQSAEQRTWGELLRHLHPEDAAKWLADTAQTPRLRGWVAEATATALTALLSRPIGRPADWLPEDSVDRLATQLSPLLWEWMQQQVPRVIDEIDVQTMVERKVLGFSIERMEQIVRRTTQRELNLIVRLGYVLGAVVGGVAYVVMLLLSQ